MHHLSTRALLFSALIMLMGCPPNLGDDDDATTDDDDDATTDDDDATSDDDDIATDDDDATDPRPGDDDDATSSDDDDSTEPQPGDDDDSAMSPLAVELCVNTTTNQFSVDSWSISGDELTAAVSYGGGCETHDFHACWDFSFLESWPVQANLVLEDWGPPDNCLALIWETHVFDLSPIQTEWLQSYMAPGEVTINLAGSSAPYTF